MAAASDSDETIDVPPHVQLHILRRKDDIYPLITACGAEAGCEQTVVEFLQLQVYCFTDMVLRCIVDHFRSDDDEQGVVRFQTDDQQQHVMYQDIWAYTDDVQRVLESMNMEVDTDDAPVSNDPLLGFPTDRFLIFLDTVLKDHTLRRLKLPLHAKLLLQAVVETYMCSLIKDAIRAALHRRRNRNSPFPRVKKRDVELVLAIRQSTLRVPSARADVIRLYRPRQSHPNRNNIPH